MSIDTDVTRIDAKKKKNDPSQVRLHSGHMNTLLRVSALCFSAVVVRMHTEITFLVQSILVAVFDKSFGGNQNMSKSSLLIMHSAPKP